MKSEVDLFSIPPTQQSLEKGCWIDYRPLSDVGNDDSKSILVVEGQVKGGDKSLLSGGGQSNVAPVNNFLHSLIKQVDVYFNGKQVTPAMGTYPYRAYLETLLNYDVSAKQSQLSSAMYYKDTAGQMEEAGSLPSTKTITYVEADTNDGASPAKTVSISVPGTGNQGFAKRHEFIKGSKQFSVAGPIFSDVFMSDRLLINMMELKVVLNRSPNHFCLMDKNTSGNEINPKVHLSNVVLKIRKVKVDQAIRESTEALLKQTPALYPIRRVECKTLTIPSNLPNIRQDNIFSGLVPTSFVFGLVDANAYTGSYGKNPYNFQHFGVTRVSLTVNGEEIPFKQLVLQYDKSKSDAVDFIQAYNTLFSGTGKMYANMGLDITRDEYPDGYTLYAFDLTPDMCNAADYFNTVQRGSLSVDITFADQTKDSIAMVYYADFENIIRIDSERNVIYDIS